MKRYISIIGILVCFTIQTACERIFDREPLDKIASSAVWSDTQLIEANLADLYASTPFFYADNSLQCTQPSLMGAEAYVHDAPSSWIQGTLDETGGVWEFWAYSQIREINTFIENVANAPIDEDIRSIRLAEARFLRVFDYFEMVKRYGGVPILTIPQSLDTPGDELFVPRNSEQEVYDFIAKECDEIADILPEVTTEYGRATRYAALALKARAMLYAASIATFGHSQLNGLLGFPVSESAVYWEKAYDAAMSIVSSGLFTLYDNEDDPAKNYQAIFLDERNSETIFAKVYNGKDQVGHSFDYYNFPGGFERNWGSSTAAYLETVEAYGYVDGRDGKLNYDSLQHNLIGFDELFKGKDPRFFASILFPEASFQEGKIYTHGGTYLNGQLITTTTVIGEYNGAPWYAIGPYQHRTYGRGFGIKKFVNEFEEQALAGESHTDFIVFRYGEVLLNLAEAAFELGKTEEAQSYINQIRGRAGVPPITSIDRERIRSERRTELMFEGHRFWDVRRWRTAVQELSQEMHCIRVNFDWETKKYEVSVEKADVVSRGFAERHYYLPITVGRISNSPMLAPENPGY